MEHCLVYYTHRGAFWHKNLYTQGQKYIYDKELLTHRGYSDNTFSQMSESPGYACGGVSGNSHWLVHNTTQQCTYVYMIKYVTVSITKCLEPVATGYVENWLHKFKEYYIFSLAVTRESCSRWNRSSNKLRQMYVLGAIL